MRELLSDEVSPEDRAFLQQTLRIRNDTFQVLLIGKDGGVKVRRRSPIPLKELFDTIDSMPMRQEETRRRKQGPG